MAGDLPFLKFDPGALNALGKDSFDAQDFAALWGPITKCKHRLSDGHRLENLIWRLWIHETKLARSSRPRVDGVDVQDGRVTDPTGRLLRPATPATGVGAELSDPEAGGSVTSASEDDDEHYLRSSSARARSFLSDRASSNDTSVPSEDELSRRSGKARVPNGGPSFLPLVPVEDVGPGLTPSLEPTARQHRAPSSHSLPPFNNLASPSTTNRPNPMTPSGLANIIQTMMPMDLAAEHARLRCLALSAEVAKLSVHIPGGGSRSSSGGGEASGPIAMAKGDRDGADGGSAAATPSVRWTAPEPGLLSQLVSAEATPVGTPVRAQPGSSSSVGPAGSEGEQLMPPKIVNIAPTPPTISPADSPEIARSKDKDADLPPPPSTPPPRFALTSSAGQTTTTTTTKATSSGDPSAIEPPVAPSSSSVKTAVTTSTRSSGSGGPGERPLRPAFAKRQSTSKTVRISPPLKPVAGGGTATAMDRRGSSGSTKGALSMKSAGRSSSLGVSLAATPAGSSSASKAKGKSRAGTEGGRSKSAKKQSGGYGSSGMLLGSPLGLRRNSSSLCTMVDALPEYKAPLRTVRGFDPLSASVNTTAAQQAAAAEAADNGLSPTGVPATPANSHASRSEASSASYPVGFPEAPPPTPAKHGAPLPTTMTAKSVALDGEPSTKQQQQQQQQSQQRAKFFFDNQHDTDDEASLSPRSSKSAGSLRRLSQRSDPVGSPLVPPPPPPSLANSQSGPPKRAPPPSASTVQAAPPVVEEVVEEEEEVVEEEEEDDEAFETETDSDEWGSEYTDSEAEEEAREADRKAKQAAFQRELFQKHEIPRNPLAEEGAGQVKRAGLSMMFHPELRNPAAQGNAPMRNQSSVELRPPPANPAKSAKPPSLSPQQQRVAAVAGRQVVGERRSFSNFRQPALSSLLKSKSSVAVPALTHIAPSISVAKSPSVIGFTSSRPPTTSSGGSGKPGSSRPATHRTNSTTTATKAGVGGAAELKPPAMARQPSRLGAKPPENTEFSDSDSDDEGGGGDDDDDDGMQRRPSREQHERLAAVAAKADQHAAAAAAAAAAAEAEAGVWPVGGHNGFGAGGHGLTGAMMIADEPTAAQPLSPRTTRRNMIATEMSESVRRNLLWERKMRSEALGIRPGKPAPLKREEVLGDNDFISKGFHEAGW